MKFAHMGDCHLGGWRVPELNQLNFESFKTAIDICIKEKVDFILIAGDLFDSAYPPMDTIKDTFKEFKKIYDSNIPVFLIAGSHDYSASGKTFLDVLETAGFCKNVFIHEERDSKIILHPTLYKNIAIYGYPGKKSGLEVQDINRIKLQDSPGLFKILMLHTAIKDALGNIQIESVDEEKLPKVDYLALSHLHIKYHKFNRVYSGPTFPNNLSELEELQAGSFYIYDNGSIVRKEIKLKKTLVLDIEIKNAITATQDIIALLEKESFADQILILKISGIVEKGLISDINFSKIESFVLSKKAFVFLKNTSRLYDRVLLLY
jgi:DNA repair exonuclease SbcCD nuclease subunit